MSSGIGWGWPLRPASFHLLSLSTYLIGTLINLVLLMKSSKTRYTRMGHLPISFYLAATAKLFLATMCICYAIYVLYAQQYSHLLLVHLLVKGSFWLISLVCLFQWCNLPHLPLSVPLSFSATALLQLIPLSNWSSYFDEKSFKDGQFAFYLVESVLVATVFVCTVGTPPLRSERHSTWSGLSHKLSLILPFVWPKKSVHLQLRVAVCLLLLIGGRIINVALPLYSKWIVNSLADPPNFDFSLIYISAFLKFLQGNDAMGGLLNTLRSHLWIPITQYTTRELEVDLFSHLNFLSQRWHISKKTGLELNTIRKGASSVNNLLKYILFTIVPTIFDIVIAVVFFVSVFNIYFGIVLFITMGLYLVVTVYVTEWMTKFRREMNKKESASTSIGSDSLLNYEAVKNYGNEQYEVDRFKRAILSFQAAEWRSNASLTLLNVSQNGIIGSGMLAGSLFLAHLITKDNTLTVGDYVLFTSYILQLFTPLNSFGTAFRTIQKSFIDMETMFGLMNEEIEIQDSREAVEFHPTKGRICVDNLTFAYNRSGPPVLKNVSFEVASGQTVALVGPSGSGKTTLIRLLFRLFESPRSSISFDGHDIRSLCLKSFRQQIGIVPQDIVLFNDTIRYNIRFGNLLASDEEVEEAAKAAMIHDTIMSLPEGYDTVVGVRGLKLSGGERQRVDIARTMLKKPLFIFLDEATSALDTHTERAIQKCFEEFFASRTGVVVAHRMSTVAGADCILVLDKGEILERGSHSTLLEARGIYYQMWQSQNEGIKPNKNEDNPPPTLEAKPVIEPEENAAHLGLFFDTIFIFTYPLRPTALGPSTSKKKIMGDFVVKSKGLVVENFTEVDKHPERKAFLISDAHCRTRMYLSAMARGVPCVSHEWILKCHKSNSLVDYKDYLLPAGVSILDNQQYPLPSHQAHLLNGKVVLVHTNNRPASAKALNFIQIWKPLVGSLGGTAITAVPEDGSKVDVLLTDASASPELLEVAKNDGAIIVSSEWLIQGIIMDELPDATAHPRFSYNSGVSR